MNLLLLEPEDLVGEDRARVDERRARHLREILGVRLGDRVQLGLVDGPLGVGIVTGLGEAIELSVEFGSTPPPSPSPVALALALPRPPTLSKVLRQATAMGVKRFDLFGARRVEKSYWQSHLLRPERIGEELRLGLEQARDTRLPQVFEHRRFRPFAEDWLTTRPRVVVADLEGRAAFPREVVEPLTLVIGPEGGFISFERERFDALGFERVSFGARALRVETAVVAMLGALQP